jgi:hypothetical protein
MRRENGVSLRQNFLTPRFSFFLCETPRHYFQLKNSDLIKPVD